MCLSFGTISDMNAWLKGYSLIIHMPLQNPENRYTKAVVSNRSQSLAEYDDPNLDNSLEVI